MTEPRLPEPPLFPPSEPTERWRISHELGKKQAHAGDDQNAWVQHRLALRIAESKGLEYAAQCSRIEIARAQIRLGMVDSASSLLAGLLVSPGLDREQQHDVNAQVAALFTFEFDWDEALVYLGRARALIQPGEVESLFWSHLLQCCLLIPTKNLVGANRELHLARCFAPLSEGNREQFSSLINVRTAEIYRARGDIDEALVEARKGLAAHDGGGSSPRPAATVLYAELLVESASFHEAIDFIAAATTDTMSYRQKVRFTEAHASALKELGMWREASIQLGELIESERTLATNAHSVVELQDVVESSRETRLKNQHLASSNERLVESNEQRAQLVEIVRRDLQAQLRSTVEAWRELEGCECPEQRPALLDIAERAVDRLSATAVQIVEMRLSEEDTTFGSDVDLGQQYSELVADSSEPTIAMFPYASSITQSHLT